MTDDTGPDEADELIGEEIQHLRIHAGMTRADLGNALGLAQRKIQLIEAGQSELTVRRLFAIADALHVDPAHLLRVRKRRTVATYASTLSEVGPVSPRDLQLAAKIARIRDDANRHDIIKSIERLVDAMTGSAAQVTVAGVTS